MLKQGKINSIGFAKKSMYEYYKQMGYNVEFVMNNISLSAELKNIPSKKKTSDNVKIGLYASGNRWVKNFYNQFAGAALVENSIIDCIPINQRVREFSDILKARLTGSTNNIKRNDLLKRMSENDINLYCTFVECAPLLPLESMEMGVPCITGNNHHYWEGTELEKYLVVDKVDNSFEIYNRINYCLKNKEKIMKLYKEWKESYDKIYKESIRSFLK
jgi:glycosyltransferase involved in cell wall biosynthesis